MKLLVGTCLPPQLNLLVFVVKLSRLMQSLHGPKGVVWQLEQMASVSPVFNQTAFHDFYSTTVRLEMWTYREEQLCTMQVGWMLPLFCSLDIFIKRNIKAQKKM